MPNSTASTKPAKPRPDFPLFPHATGYWAKKVRGKMHYFGRIVGDVRGDAALAHWLELRDDLLRGRTPRLTTDGLTVADLCNHFLTAKERQRDAGDIKAKTFKDYYITCKIVVPEFGKNRPVDDLKPEDWRSSLHRARWADDGSPRGGTWPASFPRRRSAALTAKDSLTH